MNLHLHICTSNYLIVLHLLFETTANIFLLNRSDRFVWSLYILVILWAPYNKKKEIKRTQARLSRSTSAEDDDDDVKICETQQTDKNNIKNTVLTYSNIQYN